MRRVLKRWKSDGPDAALAAEVDSLLGSERFGERWGRHWLDVARFAESSGREANLTFPHAWRYRDYVIDAVNADMPFDRFLTEQIAGDLLPAKDDAERARLLIATGFLAVGAEGAGRDEQGAVRGRRGGRADRHRDARGDGQFGGLRALPRSQVRSVSAWTDYYALAGIFESTKTFFGTWIDSENNNGGDLIRLPDLPGQLIPNKPVPAAKRARN